MLIYAAGDAAAMLILNGFSPIRLLGIMAVGATVYAVEIPNYFRWIDKTVRAAVPWRRALLRTGLAMLYFNPIWIARHLLFIALLDGRFDALNAALLAIGLKSWLVNIPLSLAANYIIQEKLPLERRFLASAFFSSLMAVYYALSEVLFAP